MKFFFYLLSLLAVFDANEIRADIYRYVSKDGVQCYTDAPVHRNSVLVIREHRKIKSGGLKSNKKATPKVRKINSVLQSNSISSKPKSLVLPVEGVISSTVGLRYDPIDGMLRNHKGVDIAIPEGTPIKPVLPGIVSFSGMRGGYGNIVIIEHENGMTTLYAHNKVNVSEIGDRVNGNSTIALSGSTGRSTGPHLHFEAWLEGQNVTSEFLADPSSLQRSSINKIPARKVSFIRKVITSDGSVLLTNLPLYHP